MCAQDAMPSGNDVGADVQSGIDTCAICLQDIGQDEAFLDNCYHRFHWLCVSSWTEVQKAHPSPSAAPFSCPLCKAPYASILHAFQDNTFRQEWVALGSQTSTPSIILTPEQRRRRCLYFQPAPATLAGPTPQHTAAVTPVEVQAWLARELQAITLEQDVKLLCQVVLGCLAAGVQSIHNTGRRPAAATKLDYSGLTSTQKQQWMDQMTAAVQPFVPDHAQQFAEHLHDFLASKLSIAGYDRMVFGESEGPSQAQAQSSSGIESRSEEESEAGASSSTSEQSSHGAGSDTGSDAYMEMLLHQTVEAEHTIRQPNTATQDAAAKGADQHALFDHQGSTVSATKTSNSLPVEKAKRSSLHNRTEKSNRLKVAKNHKHKHKNRKNRL